MFNNLSKSRKAIVVFLIALMPMGLITTEYYFMSPGPPYQWEIDYGNNENYTFEGNLFQLTVRREEANVFVISRKGDQLFDKFRSVIKFEKKQNYSVIV